MNFLVCDLSLVDRPKAIGPNDRFISYEDPDCDANWDSHIHAPISWHSYAAATSGRIVCAPKDNWTDHIKWSDTVLALWHYNPKIAMQAIREMKKLGKKVIGAFHENGDTFQWLARDVNWLVDFKNCANACDAMLTYPRNKIYKNIYPAMGIKSELLYIPQPYFTNKRSEYIMNPSARKGIYVGPKRKDMESERERRNWIYNITMATDLIGKEFGFIKEVFNKITTVNTSSFSNEQLTVQLNKLFIGCNIEVISPLNYHAYLKMIASHQVTINLDSSDTQGQIDADSMFVDVPLYQPVDLDFRTDFGDLYHEMQNSSNEKGDVITSIMTEICTFNSVKKTIHDWSKSLPGSG
ncbi:MAG: hypothetical protein JWN56_999 [Sphingobacteriales bacterium]|nr:hypothetical protein [Sphingobacteriales bacterium]